MSTGARRPHGLALKDAETFRGLFDGCYEKWEIAGSIRRGKPEVGDVEHVLIPKWIEVSAGGLFGEAKTVNAVWHRLDELVRERKVSPALYTDKNDAVSQRWGESYRGVLWNGFKHELFTATRDNWGAILLIRTGSPEYSKRVVTAIRAGGMYRQQGGQLVHVESAAAVPVPDEATYLRLAGLEWMPPEMRT